jgi:hypothetical protein
MKSKLVWILAAAGLAAVIAGIALVVFAVLGFGQR